MRKNKYRAWDLKTKKMISWSDIPFEIDQNLQEFCEIFLGGFSDRYIPMQFTGLKDKNGKEIYEGDIFHWVGLLKKGDVGFMGYDEVWFNEHTACWGSIAWNRSFTPFYTHCVHGSTDGGGVACGKMIKTEEEIEVIGNIYENPDLLK